MEFEGALRFNVQWEGRRVGAVGVDSTRLLGANRVLENLTPGEAAGLVPMLFSLCGWAQASAAVRACEAAQAREPNPATGRLREWIVAAETVRESLWRLLLDWPAAAGGVPLEEAYAGWHRRLGNLAAGIGARPGWSVPGAKVNGSDAALVAAGDELVAFVEERLLATPVSDWLALDSMAALGDWWNAAPTCTARALSGLFAGEPGLGRSAVPLMERSTAHDIRVRVVEPLVADRGFAARPHWDGAPRETGALARTQDHPGVQAVLQAHGNGVGARVLARLVELARLARFMAGRAPAPVGVEGMTVGDGVGAAWVETARGLLTHVVHTRDGMVRRYWILAPTEWNFHPDGAFSQGVLGIEAGDRAELEAKIRRHALALDPCVAYQVKIDDA